jgi:hypothetical protein
MLAQPPLTVSRLRSTVSSKLSSALSQPSLPCALTWRDRKLFVRAASQEDSLELAALQDRDRLVECLKRSPVELVKLDSDLSPEMLLWWAEACGKAKKACYVNLPSMPELLSHPNPTLWFLKKSVHRVTAIVLAVMMMPAIVIAMPFSNLSSQHLQQRWAVGSRGKLVRMWICPDGNDRSGRFSAIASLALKLINVIQGKMLLSTPMPASLNQLSPF